MSVRGHSFHAGILIGAVGAQGGIGMLHNPGVAVIVRVTKMIGSCAAAGELGWTAGVGTTGFTVAPAGHIKEKDRELAPAEVAGFYSRTNTFATTAGIALVPANTPYTLDLGHAPIVLRNDENVHLFSKALNANFLAYFEWEEIPI